MKKNTKGFILTGTIGILLLFAFLFVWTAVNYQTASVNTESSKVAIIGEYSTDGENWNNMQSSYNFVNDNYETVIFKGKLSQNIPKNQYLIISMCDVWVELKANGEIVATNYYDSEVSTITPGNSISYVSADDIPDNAEIELTVSNPYTVFSGFNPIEDTLDNLTVGNKDTLYNDLLKNNTSAILVSLAICFLGLFAFTLAGLLWKNVMIRNIALALMAITGGVYVLTDSIYTYLPLWIGNPVLCMVFDEFATYLLPIAAFLYVRVNVKDKRCKGYMTILIIVSILLTMTAVFLQLFCVMDILKSQIFVFPFILLGSVGSTICLIYEAFMLKNKISRDVLISLCPLVAAGLIDFTNSLTGFAPDRMFIRLGLLVTVIIQLYLLFRETREHHKELLRYQEMQNEMLQMRVSIMVSQIQPHFLYNSLTSIAQLCEKNPSKAKKATIEFSEYLRRNMNSLKEQAPVPFESELKHLETYLSLEKMRFGDELNVEYDIETTDFLIPSLTVQPLVENAVKHGVGMKEDGGTVTIATKEFDDRYEVIVSDDGVGFDTSKKPNNGRTHVGMENVRNRLKTMCNALLNIESTVGKGTVATITIPKEEK
ncbi:sensor histidine kinase [Ruminococcus sp.]|uniref:sensor histidine kinase n=1 Tax=Ruminococcus sp. TaxID=41978 RepID=UPI003F036441